MVRAENTLRLFTDHNIPDSMGNYLRRRGHSVFRLRGHMPADSPDPVVATAALKDDRILVTWDRDFNNQRFAQDRFAKLSRISVSGHGPELLAVVKEHIELIELRWGLAVRDNVRMLAHIKPNLIRFRS